MTPILVLLALAQLTTIAQVLIFLLVLGVLIGFHEFGHFVFAKLFGVRVTNFALGFGPTLLKFTRGETTYRLNLFPFGGYCQMTGEDETADGSADPGNLQHHPVWQRFLIIVAGPVFNFILAAAIFAYIATAIGIPGAATNVVDTVQSGTPAARAGFAPGDTIVMLDGQAFRSGQEYIDYIHARPNTTIGVDLLHDGVQRHVDVKTSSRTAGKQTVGIFGFTPRLTRTHAGVLQGVAWGFGAVGETIRTQVGALLHAARVGDTSGFGGPVGIAHVFIDAESAGLETALFFSAILSVVLGYLNLLPIPALDGGRLAFLVVEAIRGRPVDPEKEGLVHLTGFAILIVLVIFLTFRDIANWVGGRGGL